MKNTYEVEAINNIFAVTVYVNGRMVSFHTFETASEAAKFMRG